MKILRLKLENIQGVKSFEFNPQGKNATIKAQNGTGKTTVLNAFTFAMFGTMADGTTAKVHQRDESGNEIYDGTIHAAEVEIFELNRTVTIRREMKDTFDKDGNFKGTTQEFFVDGVPKRKTEFERFIEEITNGAVAVLANPFNFFKLKWQDMRKILSERFCEGFSDKEIFEKNPEFKSLEKDLKGNSAENFILKLKVDKKNLETKKKDLPGKIKAYLEMSKVDGDKNNLHERISELEGRFTEKSEEISKLQHSDSKIERNKILSAVSEVRRAIAELEIKFNDNEKNFAKLTSEYFSVKKTQAGACPTCGQLMPLEKFTAAKQEKLNRLCELGREAKKLREIYQSGITAQKSELERLQTDAENLNPDVDNSEKLKTLSEERTAIQNEIRECQKLLADIELSEQATKKVEELKAEETKLNQKISDLDGKIFVTENFIREKIRITEGRINSRFEFVKFKMFEQLKNGDLKDCCEPMIDGVPYQQLSKGEKLKAGLDVLKTLQQEFQISFPIFIDDAESYTKNSLVEISNQIIRLSAVDDVDYLQVEIEPHFDFIEYERRKTA